MKNVLTIPSIVAGSKGGQGGTTNYTDLTNKPQVNGVELNGNKTSTELGITTLTPFPSTWPTSGVFEDLLAAIRNDNTAVKGASFLGEGTYTDLPDNLNNAEIKVEILDGTTAADKVIHSVITSGNQEPYRWEYTSWNNGSSKSGWITFQLPLTAGDGISISDDNVISASIGDAYTKDNLLGGIKISIDEEPEGIDEHTVSVAHLDTLLPTGLQYEADVLGNLAIYSDAGSSTTLVDSFNSSFGKAWKNNQSSSAGIQIYNNNSPAEPTKLTGNTFTADFWVNQPSRVSGPIDLFKWFATSYSGFIKIEESSAASDNKYKIVFWDQYAGTIQTSIDAVFEVGANIWNHIEISVEDTGTAANVLVFINGTKAIDAIVSYTYTLSWGFTIAGDLRYQSVDEIRISNIVRHTENFVPRTKPYSSDVVTKINYTGQDSSLPDQTNNAGKLLTTNGTNTSWAHYSKVNTDAGIATTILDPAGATTTYTSGQRVAISPFGNTGEKGINIGGTAGDKAVCLGMGANAASNSIAIGTTAKATLDTTVAIGSNAQAVVQGTIQIGTGSNQTANTVQIKDKTLLDANGIIPTERLAADGVSGQVLTKTDSGMEWKSASGISQTDSIDNFLIPSIDLVGTVTLYTGETTDVSDRLDQKFYNDRIINGHIYSIEAITKGAFITYLWKDVTDALPEISSETSGKVLSNNGLTTEWIDAGSSTDAYTAENLLPGRAITISPTYTNDILFLANLTDDNSIGFGENELMVSTGKVEDVQQHFGLNTYTMNAYNTSTYGSGSKYLRYIASPTLLDGISKDWTFDCWFYNQNVNQARNIIFGLGYEGADSYDGLLYFNALGQMYVYGSLTKSSTTITKGTWHHFAVTYSKSNSTLTAYLDGSLYYTYSLPTDFFSISQLKLEFGNGASSVFYMQGISFRSGLKYTGSTYTVPTELLSTEVVGGVNKLHSTALTSIPAIYAKTNSDNTFIGSNNHFKAYNTDVLTFTIQNDYSSSTPYTDLTSGLRFRIYKEKTDGDITGEVTHNRDTSDNRYIRLAVNRLATSELEAATANLDIGFDAEGNEYVSASDGVKNAIVNWGNSTYQLVDNLTTTISSSSTDTQYPSAKCVYDLVGDIETLLSAINSGAGE